MTFSSFVFSCATVTPPKKDGQVMMILLHPNKKRWESGEQCHAWTMMHWEAHKSLKMSAHHVPLRQMLQTKRYVRWTVENRWKNTPKIGSSYKKHDYGHKANSVWQIESVDVEHEPRIAKISDRVFSVYDWGGKWVWTWDTVWGRKGWMWRVVGM
jgi:hypothetical protein